MMALLALGGLTACPDESGSRPTTDTNDTRDTTPDTAPDTSPADTSEPDTAMPDTAADAGDTGGPVACLPLELEGDLVPAEAPGAYTIGGEVDLGLGGPLPDAVVFEFYSEEAGTFDLGSGPNANYKTCEQCLRFIQDIDPSGAAQPRYFFPSAGTLLIDELTPPNGAVLRLSLKDLEMVEVTIRASDFLSTPVPNGACYTRADLLRLQTAECVPTCGDHVCGTDGCGGICGEAPTAEDGCAAGTCSLDGKRCEDTPTCQSLTLTGVLDNPAAGVYRLGVTEVGLGAIAANDFVQIEFYKDDTGNFPLGTGSNKSYATCNQCIRLVVDGRREFFQRGGRLIVNNASNPIGEPGTDAFVLLGFDGITLEEVLIDDEFNTTPVVGGACVDLVVTGELSSGTPP